MQIYIFFIQDDCVHIQWEGSNTQPENQAGEGRDQTDRNNMISMGGPNWNIPNGKLENSKELKSFKFGNDDYDYRIFDDDDFNFLDAKQHCERYNMVLPSPKNDEQNDQIREINKDHRGRWNGDIFVENVGRKNQNALMDRKGKGSDQLDSRFTLIRF